MTVRTLPALLVLILMGVLPSVAHAQARRVAVLDFANTAKDRLGTPERESYRRLRDQMRSQSRSPS